MKLIIDIPEEMISLIKDKSVECFNVVHYGQVLDAIYNGIPIPDNVTNGDVMELIFNICLLDFKKMWGGGSVTDDWWNAPYKSESEE